jgi:hypothetical protein
MPTNKRDAEKEKEREKEEGGYPSPHFWTFGRPA